MSSRERDALREAGLLLGSRLLGDGHLHYGYWDPSLEPCLENFPAAQQAFADHLFEQIPPDVRTILDVGCGTGLLAQWLLARGYQVDALTPSETLARLAARRMGGRGHLFQCRFEELETARRYDLLLFCESFQYVPIESALTQATSLLRPQGYLLIADFFRTDVSGRGPVGGGHRLSRVYRKLAEHPLRILRDEDITARTAPTVVLMGHLCRDYAIPAGQALGAYLRSRHPWISRIAMLLLGARLRKLRAKYDPARYTAEAFARHNSYRTMLLQKTESRQGLIP
jgi:2-polyprenyl-3-methyl-5-hydroxy-6-metoxy-1,4-benzoquinol methylase